jgi:hypothetical protein
MPTQTFDELAGNTFLEPARVRLAVRRLEGKGSLVSVRLRDGTDYVSLQKLNRSEFFWP